MIRAQKRTALGAANETTKGTAESVTTALSGLGIYDFNSPAGDFFGGNERAPKGHTHGTQQRPIGRQGANWSFAFDLCHVAASSGTDALSVLMQACGAEVSGTSDEVLKPDSAQSVHKTATLASFEDGLKKLLKGAMGNMVISSDQSGGIVKAQCDFQGVWGGTPTDVAVPSVTFGNIPYTAAGMTLTVGGSAFALTNGFTFDMGNVVEMRYDVTAGEGLKHAVITDRNPRLTLMAEADLVANFDHYGLFAGGTTQAIQLVLSDGTNDLTFDFPVAQRVSLSDEAMDNKRAHSIEFELHESSADDAWTITRST